MIDGLRGGRRIEDAEPKHRDVAQPKGQAGHEADFCDVDDAEAPSRIDAVAHGAAGKHAGADIVTDRIAGKAAQRRDTVRHVRASDRAQREQIVECECQVTGRDKTAGDHERSFVGRL